MSDNEQENENRETVADIVAEMHREANELCEYGTHCVGNYADRIEAAWKREREAIEREARSQGKDAVLDVVKKLDCIPREDSVGNASAKKHSWTKKHRRTKINDPSKILHDYWRDNYEV